MLARSRSEDERQMLERMAETWEDLANWREEQLEGQKRLAQLDRHGGNGNGEENR